MTLLIEIITALLLIGGGAIVAFAAFGVARLPDPFMRMHASTKAGVAGAGLLLLGTGLAFGTLDAILTAVAAVVFLVLTAPISAHALGRAAYVAGAPISEATTTDALAGVLDRRVFDTDPLRVPRLERAARALREHRAAAAATPGAPTQMAPPEEAPRPEGGAGTPRRILCCLVGGPAQREATAMAIELARSADAQLVGLSGAGLEPRNWAGPMPAGGAFWADWAASRGRAHMRETAASALQEFQEMAAAEPDLDVVARHEEADAPTLARLVAGHDLVVLPAGAGPHGTAPDPGMEIAASLARARLAPVLRVRRRPGQVRQILLVVGGTAHCGTLAAGLLRTGLWPQAGIDILPVAEDRLGLAEMADAQADLLRAHGRQVEMLEAVAPDIGAQDLAGRVGRYDLAVMCTLSGRSGNVFDSLRICPFETVTGAVPATLLP